MHFDKGEAMSISMVNFRFHTYFAIFLVISAAMFCSHARSLTKERPVIPLDAYLRKSGALIFVGHIERVVYIPKSLDLKIFAKSEKILPSELILLRGDERAEFGQQFIEVTSVRLIAAPQKDSKEELKKSCRFEKIYIATNANFSISAGEDAYPGSLIGKEALMFLNKRSKYGWNEVDFPSPYFLESSGRSFGGVNIYPVEILQDVNYAIKKEEYVDYLNTICKSN